MTQKNKVGHPGYTQLHTLYDFMTINPTFQWEISHNNYYEMIDFDDYKVCKINLKSIKVLSNCCRHILTQLAAISKLTGLKAHKIEVLQPNEAWEKYLPHS